MVSAGIVVTLNCPEDPPMVSVVVVEVPGSAELVWRTHTVPPGAIVPGACVKAGVQPREYSPLATEMFLVLLAPMSVIVLEVMTVDRGTLTWATKVNGLGSQEGPPEMTRFATVRVPQEILVRAAS